MIVSLGFSDIDISSVYCVSGFSSGVFMGRNGTAIEGFQYTIRFDDGSILEIFNENHSGEDHMPREEFIALWKRAREKSIPIMSKSKSRHL